MNDVMTTQLCYAADSQRDAQRLKRVQQQKKYEEESAILEEELTLEMYTLETAEGEMWGPHSYEALATLVERCEREICQGLSSSRSFACLSPALACE